MFDYQIFLFGNGKNKVGTHGKLIFRIVPYKAKAKTYFFELKMFST